MTYLLLLALAAAPTHTKYETKSGVVSINVSRVCITDAAIDAAIEISRRELSSSCKEWTEEKTKRALKGVLLFWRADAWLATSDSCLDIPKHRQVKNTDGSVSCLVVGLQYGDKMYVHFNGIWTDTIVHEMAHLFQSVIDGSSDPRHAGFVDGGCIDKALRAAVIKFDQELYSVEKYGCISIP